MPWLAGGAALVLYVLTLNHWISFINMAEIAKASGLSWQSELYYPAYHVTTWPLHFLPGRWIPLAMNLFSAVCGAVALGLLARSVMLLPHDRTHEQREREKSDHSLLSIPLRWLPPLMAVAVCGLQLTFWEHGTNATVETFDLMLVAYVIRALLEHRIDQKESWMFKAAFVYGVCMVNDWLMVGLFPAFIAAVIWVRDLSFFNLRFLGRLVLFGSLGLAFYLLFPVLASQATSDPIGFWPALKMNLLWQKSVLIAFPKKALVLMALCSLVPVIVLSFKWASYFGDSSPIGVALATVVIHVVHATLLLAGLWVLFDPAFSPRHANTLPFPSGTFSFLQVYYLASLAVGYFAGYFLIVFRDIIVHGRHTSWLIQTVHKLSVTVIVLLAFAAPATLVIKNLPAIRVANGGLLQNFARLAAEGLPSGAVVLSDDPARSLLFNAWMIRTGRAKDFMLAETYALKSPGYHRFARQQYGERWPVNPKDFKGDSYDSGAVMDMIKQFAKGRELYYLQPSFGVFLEFFYLEPHGLAYRMRKYDETALLPPPLAEKIIAENEAFWKQAETSAFAPILKLTQPRPAKSKDTLRDGLIEKLHLVEPPNLEARAAAAYYSRPLTYWGGELQKAGHLERGAAVFELAQQLNPKNVVAKINLEFNKTFRSGKPIVVAEPKAVEDFFGDEVRTWDGVLGANGPFDEPNLCYKEGRVLAEKKLYRQSALAFERVHAFAPNDVASGLSRAQLNLIANRFDDVIQIAREIYDRPARFNASATDQTHALSLLAKALFRKNEAAEAERLLETAVAAAPTNTYLLGQVTAVYSENNRLTNALANIERQLRFAPDDLQTTLNKGLTQVHLNRYDDAIATMTQLLTVHTNSPDALLYRAIAGLHGGRLDESQKDYENLLRQYPTVREIPLGLQEIALQRKDTNACIRYCEMYLSNSVPGSAEFKLIETRLREIKGVKPAPAKP